MKKLLFSSLMLVMAVLTVSAEATKLTATASTNMSTYGSNYIQNVTDGNSSTVFYSNGNQEAGQYILLTLDNTYQIGTITVVFSTGDKPFASKIQYSTDNSTWNDVTDGTVDASGSSFSCDARGVDARYVRLYLTEGAGSWLQIAEFEVYTVDVTKTATPEFNPGSKEFEMGESGATTGITITSEEGATIYYTLDGTEPTIDSQSIQHGGTVSVPIDDWTVTTTIKAVAKAGDKELSNVVTATYTVASPYCQPVVSTNGTGTSYVGQIVTLTTEGANVDANWTNPKTENYNGHVGVIGNTFTAEAGKTVMLNIISKNTTWGAIRVYVDLNGDLDLTDEGENIARVGTTSDNSDTKAVNQEFTIDAATPAGTYLMRVFYVARGNNSEWSSTDPCGTYTEGGYYDFAFNVVEATVAPHTVTLRPAVTEEGTVEYAIADGGKTAVDTEAAVQVTAGQTITLTATAATGYTFSKWVNGEGAELSTDNPFVYTPDADITISAVFARDEATGLSENVASRFSAIVAGNCIKVSGVPAGETINVYTVNSVLVASTVAAEGVNEIVVPAQGVLLVKAGSQVVKVMK